MDSLDTYFASRRARLAFGVVGALLLSALIFHAGVVFGERNARPPFGPRPEDGFRGFFPPIPGLNLPRGFIENGHGALGEVQSVATSTFTIVTRDGDTETINATNTPPLKAGDLVLVVGEPDSQDHINAKIIKILPQ